MIIDNGTYTKKVADFGRRPQFDNTETKLVGTIEPDQRMRETFLLRNPNRLVLDNIPVHSQHSVNTDRVPTNHRGMKHTEGGWADNIDPTEPNDRVKYVKKLDRDPVFGYTPAVKETVAGAIKTHSQNNQIDLYEEFFTGEQPDHLSETISLKTLMIFKDPNNMKRAITKIKWHSDNSDVRVAVSYASLRFQQMPKGMPTSSYIWNLNNPNFPEKTISAPSPLCSLIFSSKNADILIGGSYNGSISFFDQRNGNSAGLIRPEHTTMLEKSHHDPVYDVHFLQSRSASEFVTTSTDGRVLFWDYKNLQAGPTDSLLMSETIPMGDQQIVKTLGGTSLEYNIDAGPTKYLVGTEQGYILQAQKRPNKNVEIQTRFGYDSGKHHGPVYSVHRNFAHSKYFLSIGDWTAKVWCEDLKTPIMQTRYHPSYLTDGCWSQTRPGLFYLTRMDGFLDVWDFFYRQNEVAYSQKISDSPLTSINVHGSMAAIGDADGTVSIMGLCRPLYDQTLQPKEKELMQQIFEREFRREKMLEQQKRQAEKARGPKKEVVADIEKKEAEKRAKLEAIDESFFKTVADGDEAALHEIRARGGDAAPAAVEHAVEGVGATDAGASEASPQKAGAVDLQPGAHEISGKLIKAEGGDIPISLKLNVEVGGTIATPPTDAQKFAVDGIHQEGTWHLKLTFPDGKEVELSGKEDEKKAIKGSYTATNPEYGTAGTFELAHS